MNKMEVSFPGGVGVDATFRGQSVHTDQPQPLGEGTAMSPFDLFLASLATCAGFYALRFCQERHIATEGLGVSLLPLRNPETKRLDTIQIDLRLPEGFPEKYRDVILRAVDQCAVKKAIVDPPAFDVKIVSDIPSMA
ncbi:MAG TPA: OsmC family protein [Thermoanaerobaculia bacterium]|nr:OsmC family protein [Thermoanaerobaculia bacterium]